VFALRSHAQHVECKLPNSNFHPKKTDETKISNKCFESEVCIEMMKIGYNEATAMKKSDLFTDLALTEKYNYDYIEITQLSTKHANFQSKMGVPILVTIDITGGICLKNEM
jgi:hypothetical protein